MFLRFDSIIIFASVAVAKILYAGVNESGGEFGVYSSGGSIVGLPGEFGVNYAFLNRSTVPTWVEHDKINVFRVAFLLERMCPLKYGLGNKFNETYFGFYETAINAITSHGAYALLDPHNYMRYGDPSSQPTSGAVIGDTSDSSAATTKQFQEFWHELASRFVKNEKVIFGIMNEPHDMPTSLLLKNDQAAIDGIRAAGAKQLILAPGNSYTGGHAWNQSVNGDGSSADYMYKLKDPQKNTAIDIHEYLDEDFSGSHTVCDQSFPANLYGLTHWLRKHQLKAFVSEFGADNNTQCYQYLKQAINYMADNDEYIGWTMWAAGPLWGTNSPCCNDGNAWGSLEPGSHAAGGGPSFYETVWLKAVQPLVPKSVKKSGISTI